MKKAKGRNDGRKEGRNGRRKLRKDGSEDGREQGRNGRKMKNAGRKGQNNLIG